MKACANPEKKKEVIVLSYEVPTTSHKPHTLWTRYTIKKVPGKNGKTQINFQFEKSKDHPKVGGLGAERTGFSFMWREVNKHDQIEAE